MVRQDCLAFHNPRGLGNHYRGSDIPRVCQTSVAARRSGKTGGHRLPAGHRVTDRHTSGDDSWIFP